MIHEYSSYLCEKKWKLPLEETSKKKGIFGNSFGELFLKINFLENSYPSSLLTCLFSSKSHYV